MTLNDIFNQAKGITEDKTYNIGEISEKTGLLKTANGWVKPKRDPKLWKKTTDYLGRDRITMKTRQGGTVHIYESKNPKQKNARFEVDTGTHKNTFNTLEEAKAFAEKHYGNESNKGNSSPKQEENNAVKEWEESAKNDARRYKESMVIMQHPDGSVTAIRESSPDIEKAEYNGYEKISLVHPDGSVKRKQEIKDSACRITADTKIKLSQITIDVKYEDGHVSHRKNGDFVKQGGEWVPVKNNKPEAKEQAKVDTNNSKKPSAELVAKRLERAEKRKTNTSASPKTETIKWEKDTKNTNKEIAQHNGNNIVIERLYDGYYWRTGTHPSYPTAKGEAKTREEAVKQATEASKKNPGIVSAEGIEWKRKPSGTYRTNDWTGTDNGNIMRISHNEYHNKYDYRVFEEGREQQATFKTGEAKSLEEAMREAKKASDTHKHSGIRPIRIPYGAAFGNKTKWDNEEMYASKPRNK